MILSIGNKEVKYENKIESIELLIEDIDNFLEEENILLDCMIIDGIEVYLDYENYIEENLKYIEEIKVITITSKELIDNTLVTTLDYIDNARPIIDNLADEFYKSPLTDDWNELENLFSAVSWLVESFYYIDRDKNLNKHIEKKEEWNLYAKSIHELVEILPEMESGILAQDNVLIGDLLSYEIVPIFEDMAEEIINIIGVDLLNA